MTTAETDFGWFKQPGGMQSRLSWRETTRGKGELYLYHASGNDEHLVYGVTLAEARGFVDELPEDAMVGDIVALRDRTWPF